jgi:DNA-binding NtrC family response regulator
MRAITSALIAVEETEAAEESKESELEQLLNLPYRESVQAWERLLIDRALKDAKGNKAEAARMLGIHRRWLYQRLGSESSD